MNAKTLQNAKNLLEVFPTFNDLMNKPEYLIHKVLPPLQRFAFSKSQEWEGISIAVDNMSRNILGKSFTKNGYVFCGNSEKGSVTITEAYGKEHNINSLTVYKALLMCMYCSWMGFECFSSTMEDCKKLDPKKANRQIKLFDKFRFDDKVIYGILD